jgi:hypothetical protein
MAPKSEMEHHVNTYGRMIGIMKWGGLTVVLVTAIVLWLIS